MARVELITGPERRRRWSEKQELASRRVWSRGCGCSPTWRGGPIAGGDSSSELTAAQVLIAPPEGPSVKAANDAACAEPVIELEFAGKMRVSIPASIPPVLAKSWTAAVIVRLELKLRNESDGSTAGGLPLRGALESPIAPTPVMRDTP